MSSSWTVTPFVDYGFARDFNQQSNILVLGIGIDSIKDFHLQDSTVILYNRFLHARESSSVTGISSSYTVIETGLTYREDLSDLFEDTKINGNLYYINYFYPNNLVFFEQTPQPIRVGVDHEIGVTLSNLPDFLFFDSYQLGIGVRFSNNVNILRIVFGAPF